MALRALLQQGFAVASRTLIETQLYIKLNSINFKFDSLFKFNIIFCYIWFELKFLLEITGFVSFAHPRHAFICLNLKSFINIPKLRYGLQLYFVVIIIFLICKKLTSSCLWSEIIIYYQNMSSIFYHMANPSLPLRENGLDNNTRIDARYMKGNHIQAKKVYPRITKHCSSKSQVRYHSDVLRCSIITPYAGSLVGSYSDRPNYPKNNEVMKQSSMNSHESLPSKAVYCYIFMCMVISLTGFLKMVLRSVSNYETPTKFSQRGKQILYIVGNCLKLKIVRESGMSFNIRKFTPRPGHPMAGSGRYLDSSSESMVIFTQLKSHER